MNKKLLILLISLFLTNNNIVSHRKTFQKKLQIKEIIKKLSDWDIFTEALIQVESEGRENAIGKKNDVGVLQLTPIYVNEVNRILKRKVYSLHNRNNKNKSIAMFNVIQNYYNPGRNIDKAIKLHNPRAPKSYKEKILKQIKIIKEKIEMNKQEILDIKYLRMASVWSENSYAIRRKVGCLIVKNNSIISDGYNGTPTNFENVCENIIMPDGTIKNTKNLEEVTSYIRNFKEGDESVFKKLVSKPYVLHAETNAITKLAKGTQNSEGATCYITDSPCLDCSKLIIQAGIKRVVYHREYRNTEGVELLKRANIEVKQIKIIQ